MQSRGRRECRLQYDDEGAEQMKSGDLRIQLSLLAVLLTILLAACAGKEKIKVPAWVSQTRATASIDSVQNISGSWVLNSMHSEELDRILKDTFGGDRTGPIMTERGPQRQPRDPYADEQLKQGLRLKQDLRLTALSAGSVVIDNTGDSLRFSFDGGETETYAVGGAPVSNDGNLNIALAAWEGGRFVIEKNGPQGAVLEKWTPSPDGSQLHVVVQFATPGMFRTIAVNRLFDRKH